MRLPLSNRTVVGALAVLTVFDSLSALLGSVLGVALNGAGVPLEYRADSPFSSCLENYKPRFFIVESPLIFTR